MQRLLQKEYQLAVLALQKLLPADAKVSIALDGWTSPNKMAILSIIGYYVTSDWHLAEVQLGFDQIFGDHSGENMAHVVMGVLKRYNIDNDRFLGMMSDNMSSNFTMSAGIERAMAIMGHQWSSANNHMPCMAHVIQLALGAFMSKLQIAGRESYYQEEQRDQLVEVEGLGPGGRGKMSRIERFKLMPKGFKKTIEKVSIAGYCAKSPLTVQFTRRSSLTSCFSNVAWQLWSMGRPRDETLFWSSRRALSAMPPA